MAESRTEQNLTSLNVNAFNAVPNLNIALGGLNQRDSFSRRIRIVLSS